MSSSTSSQPTEASADFPALLIGSTSSANGEPGPGSMVFHDHLAELRYRLLVCVGAILVATLVAFLEAVPLMNLLTELAPASVTFIQLTPGEVLFASMRVAFYAGLVLASPVVVFQVLRFILPGLTSQEKSLLGGVVVGGSTLFLAGIAFAYFFVIPPALSWLLSFGETLAKSQMSIARFVEFCTSLLVLTGILFELPLLMLLLASIGLVTTQQLKAQWRQATVGLVLVAAIATPSQDPFSMIMVSIALIGLYWLSVGLIYFTKRTHST